MGNASAAATGARIIADSPSPGRYNQTVPHTAYVRSRCAVLKTPVYYNVACVRLNNRTGQYHGQKPNPLSIVEHSLTFEFPSNRKQFGGSSLGEMR